MGLADKIRENHELAATTQQALRNGRRVIRRIAEETPISVPAVVEAQPLPQPVPIPHTAITVSPLDLPAEQFKAGLDRRKANRELLMEWLRSALVEGVDFGRIHVASKERCQFARQGRVKECGDHHHWSKPSLFKPGAEKITGMLGMTVHYPSLPAYETAVLSAVDIKTILMRCELRDAQGHVVAEGVGARSLAQDYGDINKSLKMAEKSAHIDATLRLAGLSEVFTQDIEDRAVIDDVGPDNEIKTATIAAQEPVTRKAKTTAKPPKKEPPPLNPDADAEPAEELVNRKDVAAVRKRIRDYGFTEKRVLSWLFKTTQGTVTTLEQLSIQYCAALLKKLDQWAEAESQADGHGDDHE